MMNRKLIGAALGAGLLVGATATLRADGEEITWEKDFAAARAQAAEQGKPMLIVFR